MKITEVEVRHVARLAELAVDDAQATRLAGELAAIVTFVEQLSELGDDSAAAPAGQPAPTLRLREDVVDPVPLAQPPASFAPEMRGGFFVVPRLDGLADE